VTPWTIPQPPEIRKFTINLAFRGTVVDRKIILKQILKKENMRAWNELGCSEFGPQIDSCNYTDIFEPVYK
jgi:hypothetical protein